MPDPHLIEIRKYPNRRLYDQTRSRHVTVDEVYDLVLGGHSVRITDSKSGQDITNLVLAQMLVERDPTKFAAFPPELMHLVVRASESMLQSFVARYFDQLIRSFLSWQQSFGAMMPPGLGAMPPIPGPFGWTGATTPPANGPAQPAPADDAPPEDQAPAADDLADRIDRLGRELDAIRKAAKRTKS